MRPTLIPATSGEDESSHVCSALSLDGPAVNVRRRTRKSNRRDYLTDPHSEEPAPIQRRLFESLRILTVDIGATRTKFMYQFGGHYQVLPPMDSKAMWECPEGTHQLNRVFRDRMAEYLVPFLSPDELDAVVFAVPGTVDLTMDEDMCVVRNMPSMSPGFRGFNFKRGFRELFPSAKIYAVADNMAAAMGVASDPQFASAKCGLILVLGTAPAVATFFKTPHNNNPDIVKTVELGIWQSWVWFTKIPLTDPYGYCGGLQASTDGNFKLRDPRSEYKIPHSKSRIRFAIDGPTWKRLRGRLDWLPSALQGNLEKPEARSVWTQRVQTSIDALVVKFHQVYGRPDIVVVLGGNALKCTENLCMSSYCDPDFSRTDRISVPIFVPPSDESQMKIHMCGLAQAANYRISQVYANGPDPLARGWTRGGEIYLWARRREVL